MAFGLASGQPAYLAEAQVVFAVQAFRFDINETIIKQTADLMVGLGLKDAGYTYLTLDGEPAFAFARIACIFQVALACVQATLYM